MITGLNHITIAVSDLDRSLSFYTDTLGFRGHMKWDSGAYLSVGKLWFCLSCDKASPAADYSHIAFDISPAEFDSFCDRLRSNGIEEWQANTSEGQSLYILDPDGHKLEIHAGDLKSRLDAVKSKPYDGVVWL